LCFPMVITKWFYADVESHFLENPNISIFNHGCPHTSPWLEVTSNTENNFSKMDTKYMQLLAASGWQVVTRCSIIKFLSWQLELSFWQQVVFL
jgi:hypothetical protein